MSELAIHLNGQSLGKAHNATIGERLNLSLRCQDGPVTHPRWHISGVAVCAGYTMKLGSARREDATTGDGDSASWCLCSTGQARITAEATVLGKKLSAAVTVAVSAPKIIDFSAVTDGIHVGLVDSEFHRGGARYLTFGGLKGTVRPGIAWTAKVIGSPFTAGSYAFLQLMKISRERHYENQRLPGMCHSSGGEWVLDEGEKGVFYGATEPVNPKQADAEEVQFVTAAWPSEVTQIVGEDSPGAPLFTSLPQEERHRFDEIKVDECFQTHLMYKPGRAEGTSDGIWVSIATLEWHWKAHAKFGENEHGKREWNILDKDVEADPVFEKGYDLPVWNNHRMAVM